jgi:hypothetical protein
VKKYLRRSLVGARILSGDIGVCFNTTFSRSRQMTLPISCSFPRPRRIMYFRSRSPAAGLLPLAAAPAWRKLLRWQVRGPTTSPRDKGMALNLEATPIALPQPPGLRRRAEPDGHVTCSVVVIRVPTPRAGAGLDLSSGVELLAAGVTSTGNSTASCAWVAFIFSFFSATTKVYGLTG